MIETQSRKLFIVKLLNSGKPSMNHGEKGMTHPVLINPIQAF